MDSSAVKRQASDILEILVEIQQHLNEAHALCDAIHGSMPSPTEREEQRKTEDSVLFLVEEQTRLIEFDSNKLLPRLRDIGNRLGQIK